MSQHDQLVVPAAANDDSQSFELLRVWITSKNQHVSLRSGVWKDPGAWGLMLADLARHVANAYQQSDGLDRRQTLLRIRALFDAELSKATDDPTGKLT
jgi:hypothetical protein